MRVSSEARVCPFCGEPPGSGVFCAGCGRNLADVARLPTRAEWRRHAEAPGATAPPQHTTPVASVDAFLAAMRAAGDPGVVELPESRPGFFGRTRHAHGWVVRPVSRDPADASRSYTHGVFLTTGGRLRRLESATRGWGQRAAPRYLDTVGPELDASQRDHTRLLAELAAILRAHDIAVA